MTPTDALFAGLASLAVVSGWRVFRTWSMARASYALLVSFLAVAGVLLLLSSEFLGGIAVLMMIGEMVIMAVFMVMLMHNSAGLVRMSMGGDERFAIAAGVGVFALLASVALLTPWPVREGPPPVDVTRLIGNGMMGSKMLVFLAGGVALLATMIASLGLALHRGRYDRYGDDLDAEHPRDPIPGGLTSGARRSGEVGR
jgi:NADH:ubiquinone oxidoreductase subunit 6 (subunit J)